MKNHNLGLNFVFLFTFKFLVPPNKNAIIFLKQDFSMIFDNFDSCDLNAWKNGIVIIVSCLLYIVYRFKRAVSV